jgi:BclB C-terminal domain-containing protein
VPDAAAIIAFPGNLPITFLLGNPIDLTGLTNLAFDIPRDGFISSLSGTFNLTATVTILPGQTFIITSEIYRAPASALNTPGTNTFSSLIPVASVNVVNFNAPSVGAILPSGAYTNTAIFPLGIPISTGDRLIAVFYLQTDLNLIESVIGYASAGLNIV